MKKSALLTLVTTGLAFSSLQAGETVVVSAKNPPPLAVPSLCDCFDAGRVQYSIYGAGIIWDNGDNSDALGAGLSVGYFFTENIGIEVDGTWLDTDSNVWLASGSIVFRWPIKPACIAPYVYAGGGLITDSETDGTFHVGAGIDIRLGKSGYCPGLFADARYTWTNYEEGGDFALIRAGFRFNL